MQLVEAREGEAIDDLLRRLYHVDGLTVEEIADRLSLTKGTVSRWMDRWGIPARRSKVAV